MSNGVTFPQPFYSKFEKEMHKWEDGNEVPADKAGDLEYVAPIFIPVKHAGLTLQDVLTNSRSVTQKIASSTF